VPYWSSHLNGAESEDIVPSGHGAHQNPQAIAEVLRILKANARIVRHRETTAGPSNNAKGARRAFLKPRARRDQLRMAQGTTRS
jgi:hypothetical protein